MKSSGLNPNLVLEPIFSYNCSFYSMVKGHWPIRVLWSCSKKLKMFPSKHRGKVQFGSIHSSLQYQDVGEHPVRQEVSQTVFSCGLNNWLRVCGVVLQHSNWTSTSCVLDPDWELVVRELLSCMCCVPLGGTEV